MKILTILGMVVATLAVTLLFMRYGIVIIKTSIHADNVNHVTGNRSTTHSRDKLLVVTIPPDTPVALNTTNSFIYLNQKDVWISLPKSTSTVSESKAQKNYSTYNYLQQENSRFLPGIELVQAGGFLAGTSTSRNVKKPIHFQNASTNINPYNKNDNIMALEKNSEKNDEDLTSNTNMYQSNGRQISQRKINHNHQLNTNTAKYTTIPEEDSSHSYQDANDLIYNADDYGYESPTYETGLINAGRPQQAHQGSFWSGSSGSWQPPPYGIGEGYLVNQGPSRKPLDQPSSSTTKKDHDSLLTKVNNFDWKTISMLALFKLGLLKLQAIGFMNTLFLLGSSFKMYILALIFKFFLMMKLIKFFKILLLPLFLIQLMPSFIQLLLMPGRLLDLLRGMTDNNNMSSSQSGELFQSQSGGLLPSQSGGLFSSQLGGLLPSQSGMLLPSQSGGLLPSRPGGLLPSRPGELLPSQPSGLLPNRPAAATSGSIQRSGTDKDNQMSESTAVNHNIAGKTNDSIFKLEDTHLTNVQVNEPIKLSNFSINNFQKLLKSEKCIERIACRISIAAKTGNAPYWINWALHHIHNLIPNDKLESYLKAYKDVNKELNAESSVPDNWATWCMERYHCNTSDNMYNK